MEFFLCDVEDLDDPDGVVTQECLNKHPLSRAPDIGSGSPIDPSYPGRYYLDPPCRRDEVAQNISSNFMSDSYEAYNVKMRYVFPDIECEHCVLQTHYGELSVLYSDAPALLALDKKQARTSIFWFPFNTTLHVQH